MDFIDEERGSHTYRVATKIAMMNTLRRIIMQNVAGLAFTDITVHKLKTSLYDADYLKMRISNIPVHGCSDELYTEYIRGNQDWIVSNDPDGQTIEVRGYSMTCSVTNEDPSAGVIDVTTDHCAFSMGDRTIDNPYKIPILIFQLKHTESISFTAHSTLGLPLTSAIFQPTTRCHFRVAEKGGYRFYIASRTDIGVDKIIRRALDVLQARVSFFISMSKDLDTSEGKIIFPHDRFTLPQLIVDYLQEHSSIEFAGFKCDHLLGDTSTVFFRCKEKKNFAQVLKDVEKSITKDIAALAGGTKKKALKKKS